MIFLFSEIQTTTTTTTSEGTPPPPTPVTTSTTPRSTTTRRTLPVNPNWRPCTTCTRRWWPSYCQGWYCRRRWPYSQFYPSQRRCYSCKCRIQAKKCMLGNFNQTMTWDGTTVVSSSSTVVKFLQHLPDVTPVCKLGDRFDVFEVEGCPCYCWWLLHKFWSIKQTSIKPLINKSIGVEFYLVLSVREISTTFKKMLSKSLAWCLDSDLLVI